MEAACAGSTNDKANAAPTAVVIPKRMAHLIF
jgi:hypothetical protein